MLVKQNLSLYDLLFQHFNGQETIQKHKADTVLFQERDLVNHIYLIIKGSIAVGRIHMKGKEFILKVLNSHEILIEYQVFKKKPHYHFSGKTMTDCEFLMISREQFEKFLQQNSVAMLCLTEYLSISYIKAQMKCQDLIMNGKKGGLYSILIRLCNSYGVATDEGILIDLPLTHQELANLTYGTREVIQRALKELREKGIVSYEHHKFTIKDINYLKDDVDCQNCAFEICGLN
ncbi:Crp/Fnr family transcriptional regulator [Pseudoneobacillus sp. C159]